MFSLSPSWMSHLWNLHIGGVERTEVNYTHNP